MSGQNETPRTQPEYHDDYRYIVSWAHRRSAVRIGTPAVTQHLGYWIPDDYASRREEWVKQQVERFLELLDNEISLNPKIRNFHHSPAYITGYPGRFQTSRLSFLWDAPVDMTLELHQEYFTLLNSIDLSGWKSGDSTGSDSVIAELNSAIEKSDKVMEERYANIAAGRPENPTDDRDRLRESYGYIYHNIWGNFFTEFLARPLATIGKENIGTVFVDGRGFIASRSASAAQFVMHSGHGSKVSRTTPAAAFEKDEDFKCANTILPFMRAGVEGMEHSISRFLNGRVLYATALGAQPPERHLEPQPITYMMLANHSDRWQLGRLVDRINTLGTTRHAALYDLHRLNVAGDALHEQEQKLEEISKRLPETMDERTRDSSIREITSGLFNVSEKLAEAGQDIQGGLAYRVDRSRYYWQQFSDLAKALRIERIEGFQPYDQIVARRLGGTYDFIDMVGVRNDRARQTVAAINQQLRTVELARAQEQVAGQTRTIAGLQTVAEKAFWAFLFPYYFSDFWLEFLSKDREPSLEFRGVKIPLKYPIMGTAFAFGSMKALEINPKEVWRVGANIITKRTPNIESGVNTVKQGLNAARNAGRTFIQSNLIQAGIDLVARDVPQDIHRGYTKAGQGIKKICDFLKPKS